MPEQIPSSRLRFDLTPEVTAKIEQVVSGSPFAAKPIACTSCGGGGGDRWRPGGEADPCPLCDRMPVGTPAANPILPDALAASLAAMAPKVTDGFRPDALFEAIGRRWPSTLPRPEGCLVIDSGSDGEPHAIRHEPTDRRFTFYDPAEAMRFVAHVLRRIAAEDARRADVREAEARLDRKHSDEATRAAEGLLSDMHAAPAEPPHAGNGVARG